MAPAPIALCRPACLTVEPWRAGRGGRVLSQLAVQSGDS